MAAPGQGSSSRYEGNAVSGPAQLHFGDRYNIYNYAALAEPPSVPLSTIPFNRDSDYVHCADLEETIYEKLSKRGARVALVGLGGVGKSQLAIEYGHRVRNFSSETWVLWLHASSGARLEQSVRDNVEQLKVPGWTDPNADVFKLFRSWLRDPKHGNWPIILDNADDADVLLEAPSCVKQSQDSDRSYQSADRCLDYFPQPDHGNLLVISRSREIALKMVDRKGLIAVNPMSEEHAVKLVEAKLERLHSSDDAVRLARELEYMPLAITQAVAYIDQSLRCTVSQYIDNVGGCKTHDQPWYGLLSRDILDVRRDRDSKHSILLTWQISFERIYELRRSVADLLSLMSICDRQAIPELLLHDSVSEEWRNEGNGFEEDMRMLCDYTLVSATSEETVFKMHRLIQLATQAWLKSLGLLEYWRCQFRAKLDHKFPKDDGQIQNRAKARQLYPQAVVASHFESVDNGAILQWTAFLLKAGRFAADIGDYPNGESMLMQSLNGRIVGSSFSELSTLIRFKVCIY